MQREFAPLGDAFCLRGFPDHGRRNLCGRLRFDGHGRAAERGNPGFGNLVLSSTGAASWSGAVTALSFGTVRAISAITATFVSAEGASA